MDLKVKVPANVRRMAIGQTPVTRTLASGEKVTGWTNYTSPLGVDLILADGSFRWIATEEIA